MTEYHYRFETTVDFRHPVTHHHFILRCLPKECLCQHIIDTRYAVSEASWLSEGTDVFSNHVIYGSSTESHGHFTIISEGDVSCRHYAMYDAPKPCFGFPSPLTACSPDMSAFLSDIADDGLASPCHEGENQAGTVPHALRLCHVVHTHMAYQSGVTDSHTTAAQAFSLGKGVCQDYSHILIALCRAAGITARYVSGFVTGVGASHAWVEVYDGSRWTGLDPTNDCTADKGYVIIAHGRDADDCPLNRGIYTGPTDEMMTVRVSLSQL